MTPEVSETAKATPSFDDGRRLRRLALGSIEDPFELAVDRDDEEPIALAEGRDRELERGAVAPLSHEVLIRRLRQ
jgi:hypothetical protein